MAQIFKYIYFFNKGYRNNHSLSFFQSGNHLWSLLVVQSGGARRGVRARTKDDHVFERAALQVRAHAGGNSHTVGPHQSTAHHRVVWRI